MVTRRDWLTGLGLTGGGAALGLAAGAQEPATWDYHALEPAETAALAYRVYPEGGCMYALFRSVVGRLGELRGEPYRSFPLAMMRFGEGGLGGWGALCGVVNGAAAVIGLFVADRLRREALIQAFNTWYEQTPLPHYIPEPSAAPVPPSVATSVLCHVSLSRWGTAAGQPVFGALKKERCRRLTADGAGRVVELLNRNLLGEPVGPLESDTRACLPCHGQEGRGDTFGRMPCGPCHRLPDPHPPR